MLKKNWASLIEEIETVYKFAVNCSEDILNYNPEFIDIDENIDVSAQLEAIISKLENGGKIGKLNLLLNKQMKAVINSCRVNGHIPSKSNDNKIDSPSI